MGTYGFERISRRMAARACEPCCQTLVAAATLPTTFAAFFSLERFDMALCEGIFPSGIVSHTRTHTHTPFPLQTAPANRMCEMPRPRPRRPERKRERRFLLGSGGVFGDDKRVGALATALVVGREKVMLKSENHAPQNSTKKGTPAHNLTAENMKSLDAKWSLF